MGAQIRQFIGRPPGYFLVTDDNGALRRSVYTTDKVEEGRLAAARRSRDRKEPALGDDQRDVHQSLDPLFTQLVFLVDVFNSDDIHDGAYMSETTKLTRSFQWVVRRT